jgi:hypothetical protein
MRGRLVRLFGFVAARQRTPRTAGNLAADTPFGDYLSDEVSEYDGILLVRLAAGRAMQVRLRGPEILTRTVPIATAMQIGEHPPWQLASAGCVQAWIQSNAAIWQWLLAKGVDAGETTSQLANGMPPANSGSKDIPVQFASERVR